jgi:hypothetical protein
MRSGRGCALRHRNGRRYGGCHATHEVWPTELEPRPESRWILKNSGRKGLSDDEARILLEIMFAEVKAETRLPPRALIGFGRKRVETDWSAEELYAVGLGRLVTSREDRSHLHM